MSRLLAVFAAALSFAGVARADDQHDFHVKAAAFGNGSIEVKQDLVAASANGVTVVNRLIVTGPANPAINPGPPTIELRYRTTAADQGSAEGLGMALAFGILSGRTVMDLGALFKVADKAAEIGRVFQLTITGDGGGTWTIPATDSPLLPVPPAPGALNAIGSLFDSSLELVGPGGGCVAFRGYLAAAQMSLTCSVPPPN